MNCFQKLIYLINWSYFTILFNYFIIYIHVFLFMVIHIIKNFMSILLIIQKCLFYYLYYRIKEFFHVIINSYFNDNLKILEFPF